MNIIQAGNMSHHFTDQALDDYFAWIKQNSVAAELSETDWLESRLKSFIEIYKEIFSGSLELP